VVRDLRATLAAARERPPYVLVGASRGGIFVRVYHLDHAEEVAGLVLVDPASEDRLFTMFRGSAVPIASLSAGEHRSILPESGSFPIPRRRPQTGAPFDRLPPELYAVRVALDQRLIDSFPPAVSASVVREFREGDHAALSRLLASREQGRLKTVPLVVLTRDNGPADLSAAHAALARLSGNGRHTVVAGAGHEIHLFAPDVVVQAIRDVVMAATTGPQAPTDR
jgi:pimeloyl-ACP methyl ester carboxylesterase